MTQPHVPEEILERYVTGRAGTEAAAWPIEAHLEKCPACRRTLTEVVERGAPTVVALVRQVGARLDETVATSTPNRVRPRLLTEWRRSWTAPATLPRILMTVLMLAAATLLDTLDAAGIFPPVVLLLAPVAPLAGVAAAWSRGLDPAYELVATSPRAGLDLVLRRTLVVLAVVIPASAVAGALVDISPVRWLLPCLAFTAGTLVLGERLGLQRAARLFAAGWALAVVSPSLVLGTAPALLNPSAAPGWLAVLLAVTALLITRRHGFVRPAEGRHR